MRKIFVILGHLSLIVTAILALFFYKERVFYVDPGQQVFQMMNEGRFIIYVSRYSMVINQCLPLLAIKLGLSLQSIVIAYSISFVLIYYLCYIIAVYGFKNIAAGLAIAFAPLIIRMAFAHSISEAWLGVAYSAVFYAVLNYYHVWKKKGRFYVALYYFLLLVIISVNYFIHPVTLFTLAFSVGFTYFYKKEYKSPHIYVVSLIVICIYAYKFLFPGHEHDESFFEGVKKADQFLPQLFSLPLIQFLRIAFLRIYIYPISILLIAIILFIRDKRAFIPVYIIGFSLIYVLIAALAFYKGDSPTNLESRYIPLIFFVVIPFVEVLKERKRNLYLTVVLFIGLLFSYISLVKNVTKEHTKRIALYKSALKESEQHPGRKFFVKLPVADYHPMNSWGSATETLLLSSLNGKENSRTIIFYDERLLNISEAPAWMKCVYIWVPWHLYVNETKMLNKKYFDLQCGQYTELPYPAGF